MHIQRTRVNDFFFISNIDRIIFPTIIKSAPNYLKRRSFFFFLQEKDITKEALKVISKHDGIFYKSKIDFEYIVDSQHCVDLVTITCIIGSSNIIIAKKKLSCQNSKSL